MKVIFLDLDGVLVPEGQYPYFNCDLVRNLKYVVEATGAQIVLSSDWRRQPSTAALARENLLAYGLDFISCTPSLSPHVAQRPTEILLWKSDFCRFGQRQITAWIAIDDRNLIEEQNGHELQGHVVRTDPKVGLDRRMAVKCIQLFQAQEGSADGLESNLTRSSSVDLRDAKFSPFNESFASISTTDTHEEYPSYGAFKRFGDDDEVENDSDGVWDAEDCHAPTCGLSIGSWKLSDWIRL